MENIACFDIGGTFIKYGILDQNGNILYKDKIKSPSANCRNTIPEILSKILKNFENTFKPSCIGISTAGMVDSLKGEIIFASENLPDYTGTKLSEEMLKRSGLKCKVENDVNSAALGELWKGTGENISSFFFMTLGTGIGGSIIIDRKLYKGFGLNAGEVGHIITNDYGNKCTCGGIGCYETYASVSALIRSYCIETGTYPSDTNGEKIMCLVHEGDSSALKVYNKFIHDTVTGIINITYLLDPGLIVIGGGISEQEKIIHDLNSNFKERAIASFVPNTKIVSSSLKNDAGLIGACYVGLNYI